MNTCPNCSMKADLFVTTQGIICYDCAQETDKRRYPNWGRAVALRKKRQETAIKNFHEVKK